MEVITNWLSHNKEWFLSGIGVLIFGLIIRGVLYFINRGKEKGVDQAQKSGSKSINVQNARDVNVKSDHNDVNTKQQQSGGKDSANIQVGRDYVVNQNDIVLYSVEEVSKKLLASAFGELPANTKIQIESNQKSYFLVLSDALHKINKQAEEIKATIDSPDFQYISKKAAITASKSSSRELHKSLSALIVQRINHDKEDLQKIVYNESISTIEKLTQSQLKSLTFFFMIARTKMHGLKDVRGFLAIFNSKVVPFSDFKVAGIEFEHLAYSGCASFSIAGHDVIKVIRENYSEIFKTDDEVKKVLTEDPGCSRILSAWKPPISNMKLTSVGILLAITYYEQVLNEADANIWLATE